MMITITCNRKCYAEKIITAKVVRKLKDSHALNRFSLHRLNNRSIFGIIQNRTNLPNQI